MPLSQQNFTATLSQPERFTAVLERGTPTPGPPGLPRTIHDEGVPLPVRDIIDMVGAGVTVTDDAAGERTVVTIPGASAGTVISVFGRPGPAIAAQAGDYGWNDISGKPSSFTPAAHTHPWSEVTSKPLVFPPEAHQHPWGDLTGVPANVSSAVPNTVQVIAGTGLSGGGALTGNVTLSANIAGIQTPWLQNVSAAGYTLAGLKQLTITGGNAAGADAVTAIALDRGYDAVGDSMDLVWGPEPYRVGRLSMSLWGGGESAFVFHAQTGGSDGWSNEVFRIQGNRRIYATAEVDIRPSGDGEGGDLRLCDVDGTPSWAVDVDSGNVLRIHRLGTLVLRITPAFVIQMYLGGALKTLSVDGSGFVKAA